jgi:Sap-like sulfolipid-1-addressing protein
MRPADLVLLVGLALVDSTSVGTLLIPLWMLLDPAVRARRYLAYLGTVAGSCLVAGVLLTTGAGGLRAVLDQVSGSRALTWAQLVAGVALFGLSFWYDPKLVRRRRAARGGPEPAARWLERLSTAHASYRAMVVLGVTAAGVELLSMVPYLAAVGTITAARVGAPVWLPVLTGYVLLMVVPALFLLGLRLALHARITTALQIVAGWLGRHLDGLLGWALGLIGFFLAADAAGRLSLSGTEALTW